MEKRLLLVAAVVILVRLPFLNQPIQGDDVYYLAEAQHAQIEPLHPTHFHYVYLGNSVDMRGHSHPPLNGWILAALLAVIGDIKEVPFHAVYTLFSIISAVSMWSLAKRFSPHPLWATLLFVAVPVFLVNGNSLEADLPFLAFWMASIALFVNNRIVAAAIAMVLASLAAYQAIFLVPILALYLFLCGADTLQKPRPLWRGLSACRAGIPAGILCAAVTGLYRQRRSRQSPPVDRVYRAEGCPLGARLGTWRWAVIMVPVVTLLVFQLFERATIGTAPAAVLAGYLDQYGFNALQLKLRSAAALTMHACWLVFPLLLPIAAILAWRDRRNRQVLFLAGWIAIFFAGALVVFSSGAARYVLPIAAPIALLVSALRPAWLVLGFVTQLVLGLALATVNYQHWDAYRRFAASLPGEHRIWINADWGLRFYLESAGGLPLERTQTVRPGDLVVTSELAYPIIFTTGGGKLVPLATAEIRPALPLRLNALHTRSAYATAQNGLLPFDISSGPIDRIRAEEVVERQPTSEDLKMNAPEAAGQIVSGVYEREDGNAWRWMSGRAVILLKPPPKPERLRVALYIPDAAPARKVTLLLDGVEVATETYPAPGAYVLQSAAPLTGQTVTIVVDKIFSTKDDGRELGIVLSAVGFIP